jgi:hypothetical protein
MLISFYIILSIYLILFVYFAGRNFIGSGGDFKYIIGTIPMFALFVAFTSPIVMPYAASLVFGELLVKTVI